MKPKAQDLDVETVKYLVTRPGNEFLKDAVVAIEQLEDQGLPVYLYWNNTKTDVMVYSAPVMEEAS